MDSKGAEIKKQSEEIVGLTQAGEWWLPQHKIAPYYEISVKIPWYRKLNWCHMVIVVLSFLLFVGLFCVFLTRNAQDRSRFESSSDVAQSSLWTELLASLGIVNSIGLSTLTYTSHDGIYQSTGVFVGGSNHLLFEAKASRDAIVGLALTDSDETIQWEVAIGAGNNQRIFLRSNSPFCEGATEKQCDIRTLVPGGYTKFWLSWDTRSIRIGNGNVVGHGEYCRYEISFKLTDFYVRLRSTQSNTVDWKIHGYYRDPKGYISPDGVCRGKDCGPNAYCTEKGGTAKCQCQLGYTSAPQGCKADTSGVSPDIQGMVQTGLSAGELVADLIHDNNLFSTKITQIAGIASPLMSAVSIVFDIAFMFLPSKESQILTEMREQFREVNKKLEQIQSSIAKLSSQISWEFYKDNFVKYARRIETLTDKADDLATYPPNSTAFESKKQDVIHYYETFYDSDEFINFLTDNILGGFFESYAEYVQNDRRKCQDLMRIVLYYVTQASKVDMTYLPLKEVPRERIDKEKESWCNHFKDIQAKFAQVDQYVENAWSRQAQNIDIPNFLRNHDHLSNHDFSGQLLGFLMDKYYWRHWFVGSYNQVAGFDNHAVTNSAEAWHWFRTNNRNLAVASSSTQTFFNKEAAQKALDNIPGNLRYGDKKKAALGLWDYLPGYGQMKLIVLSGSDLWFSYPGGRVVYRLKARNYGSEFTAVYFG